MIKTDETDEQIIGILTSNARVSNREIARIIGLSDTTVRKRIQRLSSAGAAKITAIVNPAYAGLKVITLVRLRTVPAAARAIAERAAGFEAVNFVSLTAGYFNVVTLVLTENEEDAGQLIHAEFKQWDGIQEIGAVRVLNSVKHRLDWVVINHDEEEPPSRPNLMRGRQK
ncbi:Lrp/AsnC family transcriptional regulator [Novosphingobium sp. HII-3]|uniref:Lrp/AsnC family transcriptional regulator n=1 Tax=Novosphingobium sp. HII-3 TaxID=2075565 RepID=UPI000CDA17B7|nr:Lrp/AsnC family transcriptional regulator [Novosphingobium sp. HII-3]